MEHLLVAQKIPGDDFTDINATRSQDAVIIETNEQDVEEASTADIRKRDDSAAEGAPDVALVPTREEHVIGRIGASDGGGGVPFERYSSLGQRDGYESREASNGTGLFSDEKEEAGPSAETVNRVKEPLEASECGGVQEIDEIPQREIDSSEVEPKAELPASSANMPENRLLREEAIPLSKNARKTLAKQERYKEIKQQRKSQEKKKRHQETERKRQEWQAKLATLSEEELEKAMQERKEKLRARKEVKLGRKDKLMQAMGTGQNVVIDLEFGDLMKSNEISSLLQQVMYSYAANGRAETPCRLSLTGCKGEIRSQLEKISGFNNWVMHKEEKSYIEVFQDRKEDLVYLTADSGTLLEKLDISKIYVVGGLVDRNRWKGLTAEKAMNQGIATAKLPIGEHMKMLSSQVLTVNQVIDILLRYMERGDWEKAVFAAIPPRKRGANDTLAGLGKQSRLSSEETSSQKGPQSMDAMSEVGNDVAPVDLAREISNVESILCEGNSQS